MGEAAGHKAAQKGARGGWIEDGAFAHFRRPPEEFLGCACAAAVLPGVLLVGAYLQGSAEGRTSVPFLDRLEGYE